MAQNVVINGVTYSDVPEVDIPKSGGGTAKFYDTAGGDAAAGDILSGKTAYGASGSVSGNMPNNGAINGEIDTKVGTVTIPAGYTSGGSSKNIQYATGRKEISSTSYVDTGLSITVSKAGTYKCYWSMDRNTTSGTTGSRLYRGNTALGSAHTSWTYNNNNRNGQVCEETLTFSAGDVITVRARSRSTSYICGVMNFFIVEQ